MPGITHPFVSAVVDNGVSTEVGPSEWNAAHIGNNLPLLVVAANNSTAKDKAGADYLCDATADEVQVQAAIDALTLGGTVRMAPGTYNFAAQVLVTVNVRIVIEAGGATINLASGIIGFKVNQTSGSGIRGCHIREARIIGTGFAGTNVGVQLEDTNNSSIVGCYISDCETGILFLSNATNAFVEGSLIDDVLIRDCGFGWRMTTVSGTGSWMQTTARHLKIANCTTGVALQAGGQLMRSHVWATTWISTNQTGWYLDGIIEDTHLFMAVEGATAATGTTGIYVGTNASQTEQAFLHGLFTGSIATQLNNAGTKDFIYAASGTTMLYSTGFARQSFRRHGDAADRFRMEMVTGGGKLSWGDGTAAIDTNLYRSAANVLTSDDKFDAASLNVQVKAGVPVDGDVVGGAASGDAILDTTNSRLYARVGSTWTPLGHIALPARGGSVLNPTAAVNVYVWRAPFACTVTAVKGIRRAGTGATINARRGGSSNHLATALSLTSADTWMDGGSVQNTAYAAGDGLEIMIVTVAGTPTEVAVQVEFSRP